MSGTLGGGNGGPLIAGFSIPIRAQKQHETNACWATCLAMILAWRGEAFTKEQIFADAPKLLQSYMFGDTATPAETNKVSRTLTGGRVTFTEVPRTDVRSGDNFFWIAYINQFRPVIFSLGNHMRILVGYNGVGQLLIIDPGKDPATQPEPMGILTFRQQAAEAWVMDLPAVASSSGS